MRHYEIVILIHPDQSNQIDSLIESYQSMVIDGGGIVHRMENWGRKPLAYQINGVYKAYYILFNIEVSQATVDQLKTSFRYNESIVRDLFLRQSSAITESSVMLRVAPETPRFRDTRASEDVAKNTDKSAEDSQS